MAWHEVKVSSWAEFSDFVDQRALNSGPPRPTFLFRGQSDASWALRPSLSRRLDQIRIDKVLDIERDALDAFYSQAGLHLPATLVVGVDLQNLLHWWSLMQHYGAPTRLLDWTASPYVAAYFAVVSEPKEPGAVWMFLASEFRARMNAKYPETKSIEEIRAHELSAALLSADAPPRLDFFSRMLNTDRMIAQQGWFTICRRPLEPHGPILDTVMADVSLFDRPTKVVIPPHLKPGFLHRLYSMNISANSLFPGIDGIGRSIDELMQLRRAILIPAPAPSPPPEVRLGEPGMGPESIQLNMDHGPTPEPVIVRDSNGDLGGEPVVFRDAIAPVLGDEVGPNNGDEQKSVD